MLFGGYGTELLVFFCVNGLLALGIYVTWSSGQLSAAHPALGIMAGYASGYLGSEHGWPTFLTAPIGIALVTLIGTALAFPALRLNALYLAIATLGFSEAVAVLIINTPQLGGAFGLAGIPLDVTPLNAGVIFMLCLVWIGYLERSRLMMAFRAVRDDPVAAQAMGISVVHARVIAFALGSAISGLSGILYAHYVGIVGTIDFGFSRIAEAVMMVAIGGVGILFGPLLGAAIFTYLPEMLRFVEEYRLHIFAVLLIIVIVWRPQGLVSRDVFSRMLSSSILQSATRSFPGRRRSRGELQERAGDRSSEPKS